MAIAALPYVNWIFWAALTAGSLLAVGITELLGGTTNGYRLFMAGFAIVSGAVLLISELNLPGGVVVARTADLRRVLTVLLVAVTFVYLLASILNRPRAGLALLAGVIGLAALVVLAVAGGAQSGALFAIQLVLAAVALGSTCAAMLLGHWYLVTPSLSPRPLRRLIWLAVGALAVQALAFGVAIVAVPSDALSGPISWLVALRLLVGTLLPIGIGVLAILASRAPSLQASTGLLYIGLALVIAGSIAGASITYLTGVPV